MAEINKSDRSPLNGSLTFPLNQPTFASSGAPLNHQFSGVYEVPIGSSLLVNHNELPETRGLEVEAHYAHHIHASTSRHTAYGAHSNRIAAIDWVASTPPIISAVDPTLATSDNVFPSAFPIAAVALPLQKLPAPLFWEAKTFLEALRQSWRSSNLVSFSQADADQLQTLFNKFKECEKRKIKSLLRYSGNKIEFVQTALQGLSERLKDKKGFVGHYHKHDSRHPTQLLQDYLVVRLSGTTKYMSSSCGRFNSGSSCTHCSNDMNHSTNPGKCWRTWQHVMICLSASLQGHRNIWACFESGCSKLYSSSENLVRHRRKCYPEVLPARAVATSSVSVELAPSNFNSDRDGPPRRDWIGDGTGAGDQFSESSTAQRRTGLPDHGAPPGYPDATQTRHPVPSIMAEQQREYSSRSRTPNRVAYSHLPSTSTPHYGHDPFQSLNHEPLVQQRPNGVPQTWEQMNKHGVGPAVSTSYTQTPLFLPSEHWPGAGNSAVRCDHLHTC